MVAQALQSPAADVRLVTEIRGAAARLWDGVDGEVVISGSAGTGKTRAILEWIHQRCQQERLRVLFLRKTEESLKSSALVTFQEQVLHGFDGRRSRLDGVTYFGGNKIKPAQFTYEATRSIIVGGGMDNPNKVKSSEWDIVFVNEATELALNDWEMITGRTDRPTLIANRPPSVIVGDCNPDAPTHWIRQRANEGRLQLWPSYHEDNPAMWDRFTKQWTLSGERYLARLDALTGVRYQRLRLGKWVAAEGIVYDSFDRAIHVVDTLPETITRSVAGVDWGYTNPGTMLVFALDGDERMTEVYEVYQTRKLIDWWVDQGRYAKRQFNVEVFVCDPSEPAFIQAFNDAGLNAIPADNAILPGIQAVQQRLAIAGDGRPRLQVYAGALAQVDPWLAEQKRPTCLLDEIDSYVWAQPRAGSATKEKPVDEFNHAADAGRYAVLYVDDPADFAPLDNDLGGFFLRHGLG